MSWVGGWSSSSPSEPEGRMPGGDVPTTGPGSVGRPRDGVTFFDAPITTPMYFTLTLSDGSP